MPQLVASNLYSPLTLLAIHSGIACSKCSHQMRWCRSRITWIWCRCSRIVPRLPSSVVTPLRFTVSTCGALSNRVGWWLRCFLFGFGRVWWEWWEGETDTVWYFFIDYTADWKWAQRGNKEGWHEAACWQGTSFFVVIVVFLSLTFGLKRFFFQCVIYCLGGRFSRRQILTRMGRLLLTSLNMLFSNRPSSRCNICFLSIWFILVREALDFRKSVLLILYERILNMGRTLCKKVGNLT